VKDINFTQLRHHKNHETLFIKKVHWHVITRCIHNKVNTTFQEFTYST